MKDRQQEIIHPRIGAGDCLACTFSKISDPSDVQSVNAAFEMSFGEWRLHAKRKGVDIEAKPIDLKILFRLSA